MGRRVASRRLPLNGLAVVALRSSWSPRGATGDASAVVDAPGRGAASTSSLGALQLAPPEEVLNRQPVPMPVVVRIGALDGLTV